MSLETLKNAPVMPDSRLRFTRAGDLELRAPDWLIRGRLERGSLSLLIGTPGAGKSFAAVDISGCVASGKQWADSETTPGPVLYLAGEGVSGIARRLTAWCIRNDVDRETLDLAVSNGPARLCEPEGVAELEAAIADFVEANGPPSLLVVDTLARSFGGGDENSNSDMGEAIAALDRIKSEHGCAVLLVHHSGHKDQGRARGASALFAATDTAFTATKGSDGIVAVEWTKAKDTALPDPLAFDLRGVDLPITDDRGEPITSAILEPVDYDAEQATRAMPTPKGPNQRKALAALNDLYQEHQDRLTADGRDASMARVSMTDWRSRMREDGLSRQRAYDQPQRLREIGLVEIQANSAVPVERPVSGPVRPHRGGGLGRTHPPGRHPDTHPDGGRTQTGHNPGHEDTGQDRTLVDDFKEVRL